MKITVDVGYGTGAIVFLLGGFVGWVTTAHYLQSIAISAFFLVMGIAGFVYCVGKFADKPL